MRIIEKHNNNNNNDNNNNNNLIIQKNLHSSLAMTYIHTYWNRDVNTKISYKQTLLIDLCINIRS